MSNEINISPFEPPLVVAQRVERSYWGSGVSMSVQATAVAAALVIPMLELADVPTPLHAAFRDRMHHRLKDLFGSGYGVVTDEDINMLAAKCRRALPTAEQARAAHEGDGLLTIGSKAFWAQGYLHHLGHPQFLAKAEPDLVAEVEQMLVRAAYLGAPVAKRTEVLTKTLAAWSRERGFRPAREVSVPVLTPGSTYYGRNDIILFRKQAPAIVIEIDSTPNGRSAPKLEFAFRAGAVPLWVRFHQGEAQVPPRGVSLIDLCS